MFNIWHDIEKEYVSPEKFMAVIEIPAGSKKKYELDKKTGMLVLDRILYTSTHYPGNYGFIPLTYAPDSDPLDVIVLCSEQLDPMIMVECKPLGALRMIDENECDDKIIAVPCNDPRLSFYKDINQLPPHMSNEIAHFFEVYKNLEHKETTTSDILNKDGAIKLIHESMIRYQNYFRK